MEICKCDKPVPPCDSNGRVKGNVCKECHGKIEPIKRNLPAPSLESSTGRVMLAIQDVMERADFRSDQEANEFAQYVCRVAHENMRQQILTWRVNKATPKDIQQAQEIDRAKRGAI